jgi:hypothetical protein
MKPSSPKCMEHRCRSEADAECEGCGEEFCFDHLTEGLCDICVDSYLGLEAPVRTLPRPTTYRAVA